MLVDCTISGLTFSGSYDYEASTGPTYSCGGTPGGTDVDIWSVEVDDPADPGEFLVELAEYVSVESSKEVESFISANGVLPATIKGWIMEHYRDEAIEALTEAAETWEPEYDEYSSDD